MMGSGFGFGIPGLGMLVFWGLIIYLVIWLVRGSPEENRNSSEKSVLDILDESFARDEIGQEEYEEKKKALT